MGYGCPFKEYDFPALEVIPVSAKWYVYSKNPDVAEHLKISPVIRLTEMNYILAECHAQEWKLWRSVWNSE